MTSISQLGVDQLSLRGSGTDYNILSRFFATKAQADAALADSSWVPTAGKTNGCLTGDQGLLVYDFGTSALVVADSATRAYVDTEVAAAVAALVDSAPGTLDTLNELAAAIADDANIAATLNAAIAAVQADVDQNEADADAAIALKADLAGAAFTGDISTTGDLDVAGNLQIDNDGGYYIHFDRNTATQLDLATGNIPSGGNLNIKNSNGTDARVVVYSDEFWVRNLGGNSGNGTAKFDGNVTFGGSIILDGTTVTATGAELNYVDGVTSNIQTQLDAIVADVTQNDTDIDLKANIASPTFTGTPAAPTATAGTNTTQLATTAFVTAAVAAVIDSAPGALDTLNELAAALGDDANFATTITNSIAAVQADVDQNEVDSDAAEAALSARITTLEADPTTAAAVALKADIASPALTGTPTAPTAAADTNTTQIATTAYVQTEIADLIDGAPAGLNTLNELAAALNDDVAALTNITTLVNANETHVDNLVTLTGVAKDAVNFGTFTGSTITDNVVLKVALQELETEVETKLAAETITLTSFKAVVAASSDFADFKSRVAAL